MAFFFKILLFFFIVYFLFNWLQKMFNVTSQHKENQKDVRIFKDKELEKPSLDMHDAETVDFEEIKNPREKQM